MLKVLRKTNKKTIYEIEDSFNRGNTNYMVNCLIERDDKTYIVFDKEERTGIYYNDIKFSTVKRLVRKDNTVSLDGLIFDLSKYLG